MSVYKCPQCGAQLEIVDELYSFFVHIVEQKFIRMMIKE